MKLTNKKSGFTLLEIIIVIIIVGVLASLALPRFFQTVEYSRSTEAMNFLASAKRAADRCSMLGGAGIDYSGCDTYEALGLANPGMIPESHYCYDISSDGTTLTMTAERNILNGGDGAACVVLDGTGTGVGSDIDFAILEADGTLIRSGTGMYAGIK